MSMFRDLLLGKKTEESYITDGLMLYLDGINNTRSGHSSTTQIWEDLSGNNRDFTKTYGTISATDWEENCLYYNRDKVLSALTTDFNVPTSVKTLTVEVVFSSPNVNDGTINELIANRYSSGTYNWMVIRHGKKMMFHSSQQNNSGDVLSNDVIYNSTMTINIPTSGTRGALLGYLNNSLIVTNNNASFVYSYNTGIVTGANSSTGDNERNLGRIYAIRIYNRVLTEDERAYNYNIDKTRFGF